MTTLPDQRQEKCKNGNNLLVNISKYGAASVIGVYLAWQLAIQLPPLREKVVQVEAKVNQLEDDHDELRKDGKNTIKLLRSICINTADTKEDHNRCNP